MAARSPARFLAPLALLAVAVALYLIVTHNASKSGSGGATTEQRSRTTSAGSSARHGRHKHGRRFYTVKPGDTPSGIAEKTGVPLATIERLNPHLDPQALSPGTRLKLRR
jgi:LysM repeat protein